MSRPAVDVSVCITTFRRPRHLALALESLTLQRCDTAFEVIVSDDGSGDDTPEVVRRCAEAATFPVRFTSQPHDGFRLARVRNEAARAARGRYLLFLDGDCMVPRHHVAAHVARRRAGTALLGYCARLSAEASERLTADTLGATDLGALVPAAERRSLARRRRKAWWHAVTRHPSKPRLAGGDFGVWRDDFERVNGFDERFVGWGQEDDDLGLRLRASGVRLETILGQTRSLHVWHDVDATATPRWRDGVNVPYFQRPGRLTACRQGLVARPAAAITWGLPTDIDATPVGRWMRARLASAVGARPGAACEIDLVIRPGNGSFTRPSECRLAVVVAGTPVDADLRGQADSIVEVGSIDDAARVLDEAG